MECIINTGLNNCPHPILSGKICSGCKIPDETFELWYNNHNRIIMCDVCGSDSSSIELLHNDGKCFNCNTQLN